jgi:predicted amidohydrolase
LIKVALAQINVADDKKKNVADACSMISTAAANGAIIVALGEMFNCPYSGRYFSDFAEEMGNSYTLNKISKTARDNGVYVIAGSIPERDGEKVYNTSFVFDKAGNIIGSHRKAHLFDVDIKDGIRFMESQYLAPGDKHTVFDTEYGKVGLCICYDIRFPELIRTMVLDGAKMIFVLAAFNMTTGPAHWEILFRTRAMDNQVYIFGISPARNYEGVYTAYGNSIAVDPWGKVIAKAGAGEEIVYAQVDLSYEEKVRQELPLLKHRRTELYHL